MATQTIRIVISETGSKQAASGIKGIAREATAADRALGLLKTALAAVGVGAVVREYVRLSDAYQTLQNRLKIVTDSERSRLAVTRELIDIATETFSSLEATGELYARLALNTRQLGIEQKDVLTVTKALNQAVILSGAGVREAANGLIQLSQGLASNSLRGDELRAVLEQLPFVADVIAQKLGVARGAIRLLAFRGEIDAKTVVEAFLEAADSIDSQFTKLQPTIGQAFQVLRTQLTAAVGEFNAATGASSGLANAIIAISTNIEDVTDIVISFFEVFNEYLDVAAELIEETFGVSFDNAGLSFRDFLKGIAVGIDGITGIFVGVGQALFAFWSSVFNNLRGIGERIVNLAAGFIEAIVNSIIRGINAAINGVAKTLNSLIDAANEVSEFVGAGRVADRIRIGNLVDLDFGRVDETPFVDVGEQTGQAFVKGFNMATGAQDFLGEVLQGADRRRRQREAAGRDFGQLPQQEDVLSLGDLRLIQLREEIASQQRINLLSADRSVLAAQEIASERFKRQLVQDSVKAENDQQRLMIEELDLLVRQNAERKIRADLDRQVADFTRDLEDQLRLLSLTSAEREVEADLLRLVNSYKEAGLEIDQTALDNLRTLRTEVQQRTIEEQILNGVFGDRARLLREISVTEQLLAAETDANRRRALERLQAEQRIAARAGDPSLLAGFENGLDRLFLKVSDVAGGIEQAMTNAFSAAEDAIVDFVMTGEFNFSKLVDSILADITRLLARQAILAIFNALTGGTSGAFGGVITALAGARAEGGPVSMGQPYLVGERGPEIFQPNQSGTIIPNNALPAAAPQSNVTVVNVLDPSMVNSALNDPENEQVIVNIIGKNRSAINRQLGNA